VVDTASWDFVGGGASDRYAVSIEKALKRLAGMNFKLKE